MNKELDQAIGNLYKVFGKYPINLNMNGSPLYDKLDQWNKNLTSKKLKEISENDLMIFYFKAITTWGDVDDFKHYLPRIFELLARLPNEFEEWVTLDKLNYGRWINWPLNERQVVDDYLIVFWKSLINRNDLEVRLTLGNYFAAIANVYPDFIELLNQWEINDSKESIRNLTDYIFENTEYLLYRKVLPGFYESKERGEIFYEWVTNKKTIKILEDRFFKYANENFSENLSIIIQMIESRRL